MPNTSSTPVAPSRAKPDTSKKGVPISAEIPAALHQNVTMLAAAEDRSLSSVIRIALVDWVASKQPADVVTH